MFLVASLAPFVLLATEVAANPVVIRDSPPGIISLPITKRVNLNADGSLNVIQRDQARVANFANQLNASTKYTTPHVPLSDSVVYVANIGVGDPLVIYYELIVDTASANTWIGANLPYQWSPDGGKTPFSAKVTYGNGYFKGAEYIDTLTFTPGVALSGQYISVASESAGFFPLDGVLAIGPNGLTHGSLSPDDTSVTLTVTDNLFDQKIIQNNLVAVSFEPTTLTSEMTGELTFGGIDTTRITESPTSFPLTNTPPASNFWGVDASFRYGDGITLMDTTGSGIIDSGVSLIYLATDAYNRYVKATGADLDEDTGFLYISAK